MILVYPNLHLMLKIGETLSLQEKKKPFPSKLPICPLNFHHPLYPTIKFGVYHFSYVFPPLLCPLLTYLGKCPPRAACAHMLTGAFSTKVIPNAAPLPLTGHLLYKNCIQPSDCDTRHLFDKSQSLWEHPWIETLSLGHLPASTVCTPMLQRHLSFSGKIPL